MGAEIGFEKSQCIAFGFNSQFFLDLPPRERSTFTGDTLQHDDMTAVIVKILA